MPVLVDVPVVVVALVGAQSPQAVQVTVSGLTAGLPVTVTGSAAGASWVVRGGAVTSPGEQVILTDVLAPLNVPITYSVSVDGYVVASDEITVPYGDRYVLQSLDGRTVFPFVWQANGLPREVHVRSAAFDVPGRSTPVVRWDTDGGEAGQVAIRTSRAVSNALRTYLREVGPALVVRTDGSVRDLPPAEFWLLTRVSNVTWDAVVGGELSTDRVWSLGFEVIDDPEPSVVVAVSTWDDFDAVYAESTWDDFDAEWAGGTWDEFDQTDWATRADA